MNTLVDLKDGATQVPETKQETAPSAPDDAAIAPRPSDATLIEIAGAPAASPTLVELAPASGRTLILPDGAGDEAQRAWAHRAAPTTAAAPAAGERARRLFARARSMADVQDRSRLKRMAPFAVGVASLLATGIPLWFRAPRPPAAEPATLNTVRTAPPLGSPLTVDYPRDREAAPAPDQPAEAAGTTASGARSGARPVGPRLIGDRRGRARAAVTARWKGRAGVLRTRNGSPVVD